MTRYFCFTRGFRSFLWMTLPLTASACCCRRKQTSGATHFRNSVTLNSFLFGFIAVLRSSSHRAPQPKSAAFQSEMQAALANAKLRPVAKRAWSAVSGVLFVSAQLFAARWLRGQSRLPASPLSCCSLFFACLSFSGSVFFFLLSHLT